MARTYRLGPGRKAVNQVMGALLKLGVPAPQKTSYLMTTRGRRSGRERTVPVNLIETDGARWLVSPYGDVGWVHNLRADGVVRLRRGRTRESLLADEVGSEQAGPILQHYVRQVRITAPYFDARGTDPVEQFVAEAGRHPVFRLTKGSGEGD